MFYNFCYHRRITIHANDMTRSPGMLITIKIQSQKILLLYGNPYIKHILEYLQMLKSFFYLGRATPKVLEKQAWRLSDSKRELRLPFSSKKYSCWKIHTLNRGNELSFETAELIWNQTFPFKNGLVNKHCWNIYQFKTKVER